MKKIITFIILLVTGFLPSSAQEIDRTFIFVDNAGKEVADGKTINVNAEEGAFGPMVNSGLFVKNTSAEEAYVLVEYAVSSLPNGVFQICFPQNCIMKEEVGHWSTPAGPLAAGEVKDLNSEWMPEQEGAYGIAKATYQLKLCTYNALTKQYTESADGPRVEVVFHYADPASVSTVSTGADTVTAVYDMAGRRLSKPQKGLSIVRMANGQTVKRIIP